MAKKIEMLKKFKHKFMKNVENKIDESLFKFENTSRKHEKILQRF